MKSIKTKIFIAMVALMGCAIQPADAQAWVRTGRAVSKQAAKAIGKGGSKKAATTISKSATKKAATTTTVGTYGASRSAAAAASQYTTVTCTTCSGRGWYPYNGYRYQCSSCSGYGYRVVRR